MKRACKPEILDSLPHDHRDAVHNRRDLRVINLFMRNRAWFERTLQSLKREGELVLEVGAGLGELGLSLIARGFPVDGLDLWPRPAGWPAARSWHRADLRTFRGYGPYPVVMGNLIFHQFGEADLAEIGAALRRSARAILACEPQRRRLSQVVVGTLAPLLGANHVTLHDAHVSIAAGFRGDELPRALGLDDGRWKYSCSSTALGVNRVVAVRVQ